MSKPPILEFSGVTKTFPGPPQVQALRGCDVTIHAGELVTVCGASGSGKSTWLNLAGLLDSPTTGTLRFNGVDTATLSANQVTAVRGAWIGFVFQAFHLMPHRSVVDNIALAGTYKSIPYPERQETARALAARVGLAHRADSQARLLSGGEMQRTAIARALMGEPLLILCDEPTGNLDSTNGRQVMDLLHELHDVGKTIAIITHDPVIAAEGSHQLHIHDGVVSAGAQD